MGLIPDGKEWTEWLANFNDLLDDIDEYLDNRADADVQGDPPRYVPNAAMELLCRLREMRGDAT